MRDIIKHYLPYNYTIINDPLYKGTGNHSVTELEQLCHNFTEVVHQKNIIIQNMNTELEELADAISAIKLSGSISDDSVFYKRIAPIVDRLLNKKYGVTESQPEEVELNLCLDKQTSLVHKYCLHNKLHYSMSIDSKSSTPYISELRINDEIADVDQILEAAKQL